LAVDVDDLLLRRGWVFAVGFGAEDDFADFPNFVFEIEVSAFEGVFDFEGVFSGFAGGVEVELAFFLGEEFAFESEALLFEAENFESMSDAGKGIDGGGVWLAGKVVAGVGEFQLDGTEELFAVGCACDVVELGLGEFLGVAAAAFSGEETPKCV
jgi:hypothetical protein